jgi:hypothetical protein
MKRIIDASIAAEINLHIIYTKEVDEEAIHFDPGNEKELFVRVLAAFGYDPIDIALAERLNVLGHADELHALGLKELAELRVGEPAIERPGRMTMDDAFVNALHELLRLRVRFSFDWLR